MNVHKFVLLSLLVIMPMLVSAQTSEVSQAELYAGGPAAPIIISTDMPIEDSWYQPQDATFHWGLPADVVAVAAELATNPNTEPSTTYRPPVESITFEEDDWTEGFQYVSVQFRNEEKWGMYAERIVRIDATPPAEFPINISPAEGGSGLVVSFDAVDALSGVAYYELKVNGLTQRVSLEEAKQGHFVPLHGDGPVNVYVTAYDQAGNSRLSETVVYPMLYSPTVGQMSVFDFVSAEPASTLAAIMAALLLLTFGYMVFERQRYAVAIERLRQESDDVQQQILKIFNALRLEIYDQINAIDGKTRVSKKEKEAVEGLTKALKVSEKLLKKEVKDIKKLLD